MKTLGQLTKKYRSQLNSMKKIKSQIDQLRTQEEQYQEQINVLHKEIEFTKLVLDYCVLTGESPAEAVLKNTREQIQMKIYEVQGFNVGYGAPSSSWGINSGLTIIPTSMSITNTGNVNTMIGATTYDPTNNSLTVVNSGLGVTRVSGSGGSVPGV